MYELNTPIYVEYKIIPAHTGRWKVYLFLQNFLDINNLHEKQYVVLLGVTWQYMWVYKYVRYAFQTSWKRNAVCVCTFLLTYLVKHYTLLHFFSSCRCCCCIFRYTKMICTYITRRSKVHSILTLAFILLYKLKIKYYYCAYTLKLECDRIAKNCAGALFLNILWIPNIH